MKTKLLLIAWLCLHAVQALAAFTPSGTKVYTIKNLKNSNYAAYNAAVMSGSNNILTAVSSINAYSFFIVEDAGGGYFTIKVAGKERYYVYAINTSDANSNVGVKQLAEGATIDEDCKWSLTENATGTGYYNIKPKSGSNGWNIRGTVSGVSTIGQWNDNNTNDNRWQLSEVTTANLQSLVTSLSPTVGTTYGQVATDYPYSSTINDAWATFSAIAEESRRQENVITLCQALQTVEDNHWRNYLYLPSGYYYIHSAQESGDNNPYGAYWFDDPYNVLGTWNNPNGYTLGMVPTSDQKVKNNFIWKVTRAALPNNTVGIVNGTGSNVKGNAITATSSLTLGLSSTYAAGTVYFTQGTHLSNQAHYTLGNTTNADAEATRTNPFFLTQWAYNDSEGSKVKFEEVTGMDVYTVTAPVLVASPIPGSGVYTPVVTLKSTGEMATNNGFFAVSPGTELAPSDFECTAVDGKDYTVNVSSSAKTITVTYAEKTTNEYILSKARTVLSKGGKVGYPTTSTTVYTNLQAAINTAEDAGEDVTTDEMAAVTTATNAFLSYGANTGETDITYPEEGKAYTMTFVACTGQKFYMNYNAAGYTCVETSDLDNTNYPEEAILICRDLGDGKYAFQNTAGKYMCWKGTDTNSGAYNSNKGFSDTYNADYTWIGVEKIVVGKRYNGNAASFVEGSQSNLFGAVAVKGYRNDADNNNIAYYVINHTSGAYNRTAAPYYNNNYTSAILIEPVATVTYNPQPPMNNSEGAIREEIKKVATYSAPIAIVVPRNVKAYYVSASEGAGGQATLVAWPAAPNGQQVLPASTGVILTSTDADATLAALTPATSETVNALPSGSTNLLQNTAAGPHTFAANEGFILAKGTYGVGLYKAKAGSTLARNKAYLDYSNPTQSVSTAVRMVIGGNTPTDITHLMPQEDVDEQAPIYDLSGRRVQHTVKGGLYIRNGRKFIVR